MEGYQRMVGILVGRDSEVSGVFRGGYSGADQ